MKLLCKPTKQGESLRQLGFLAHGQKKMFSGLCSDWGTVLTYGKAEAALQVKYESPQNILQNIEVYGAQMDRLMILTTAA